MRKTLKRATAFILLFMLTIAPPLQGVSTASVATTEQWINDLRSKNREVWLKAAYDYRRLEPITEAVVNRLVAGLKDKNSNVRRYCASALGEFDSVQQAAVQALLQALQDRDYDVRGHAAVALAKIGAPAVKSLVSALRRTDIDLTERTLERKSQYEIPRAHIRLADYAAITLMKMGRPAVSPMVELLNDSDETVRRYATFILEEIGADALPVLLQSVGSESGATRLDLYSLIAKIDPDAPLDLRPLANGLRDSNLDIRRKTVGVLRSLGNDSPVTLGYLTQAVSDADEEVARQALDELTEWGEKAQEAAPAVAAVLLNTNSPAREEAARALGAIGPGAGAGVPALLTALRNGNADLQRVAVEALGEIGSSASDARPVLIAALDQSSPDLKEDLLYALGKISGNDPNVINLLARHLKDPAAPVRHGAARGLGASGVNAQSALPAIVNAIEDLAAAPEKPEDLGTNWFTTTRPLLFDTLLKIGAGATPHLTGLLHHKHDFIRLQAAASLLQLHPDDRKIISAIIPLLRDPSNFVREGIPLYLVKLTKHTDLAVHALADALKNADRGYVHILLNALEEVRGQARSAIPAIEALLKSNDSETRMMALETLLKIGPLSGEAIKALGNELKTMALTDVVHFALRNFGKAAAQALAEALTNALQDGDPDVRRNAAKALGEAGEVPKASIASLAALLTDADEEVRLAAAKTLTRLTTNPTQFGMALSAAINDAFIHRLVTDALSEIINNMRFPSGRIILPSNERYTTDREPLPKFPWPPPRFTNYDLMPRNLVGADQNTLADVHTRLAKALQESGYYSNGLFGAPGGFAVVTRVERILNNGAPFPADTRWTKHKLTPSSLLDYLGSLFLERPGEFRMFVFVVTDLNGIQSGGETLSEDDAFGFAQRGAKILPDDVGKISFKGRNCYALVYRFQKRFGQNTILESVDSLSLEAHLKGAGIWGRLGF